MDFQPSPADVVELFDRVAPRGPDVTRRKMFGFPAAFVNGNLCCGTFKAQIMLRVPGDPAIDDHLAALGARPFSPMPGRPMKGYVAVTPGPEVDDDRLRALLEHSAQATRALPPRR